MADLDPRPLLCLSGTEPEWALFLGSGLSSVAGLLGLADAASFADVGLPAPGVAGHAGRLHVGDVAGRRVVAFAGRLHLYEGHTLEAVTRAVRLAAAAGSRRALIANAAGGLAPDLVVGDFLLISDHISLPGLCGYPGTGPAGSQPWPRFVSQDGTYDERLLAAAARAGAVLQRPPRAGVYAMVGGPQYESPAERSFLHRLGADAVGMSTAPEALAAHAVGMRVLGLSVITNTAAQVAPPTHEEVARVSAVASASLAAFVEAVVRGGD
ncbi:MAG: purine-nucleoside phosphorylase [Anaerolineae bacterium]